MDKEEILRLAREAFGSLIFVPDENGLLRFAALVAAAERERILVHLAGIFDSERAIKFVEDAIAEIRSRMAPNARLTAPDTAQRSNDEQH